VPSPRKRWTCSSGISAMSSTGCSAQSTPIKACQSYPQMITKSHERGS
jgi:hypothetical protein